jgi:hypothetical protein
VKNGDFNDYALLKNITPVTTDLFTSLFNGKNLEGWYTFLKDIEKMQTRILISLFG